MNALRRVGLGVGFGLFVYGLGTVWHANEQQGVGVDRAAFVWLDGKIGKVSFPEPSRTIHLRGIALMASGAVVIGFAGPRIALASSRPLDSGSVGD